MKANFISISAIAALFFFVSCKKSNPSSPNQVSYQFQAINRSATIAASSSTGNLITSSTGIMGGTINWTSGYASATEIRFDAEGSGGHVKFNSETPQKIDLFSTNSLGNIIIPTGVYDTANFEIELASTPTDSALELSGMYNNTPVVFAISGEFEIDGELPKITITDGSSYTALTALNLANLTQGIAGTTLDAATKDSSGTILISASSNPSIYDAMVNNLKGSEEEDFH